MQATVNYSRRHKARRPEVLPFRLISTTAAYRTVFNIHLGGSLRETDSDMDKEGYPWTADAERLWNCFPIAGRLRVASARRDKAAYPKVGQ